jgi:hypothetical protein
MGFESRSRRPPNLNPDNPNCEGSLSEAKERLHALYMQLFSSHVADCERRGEG